MQAAKSPSNNYAINVHEYFSDPNGCGSECSSSDTVCCVNPNDVLTDEMFQPFVDWLQSTKQRAFLTELNGNSTTNCDQCIYNFLVAVQNAPNQVNNSQNTGGFIGWTGWAAGHAWPVDYVFNLAPYSDGTQRTQMINGFNPQLTPPQ